MMKVVFFFRLAFDLGKRLKGFKYDVWFSHQLHKRDKGLSHATLFFSFIGRIEYTKVTISTNYPNVFNFHEIYILRLIIAMTLYLFKCFEKILISF